MSHVQAAVVHSALQTAVDEASRVTRQSDGGSLSAAGTVLDISPLTQCISALEAGLQAAEHFLDSTTARGAADEGTVAPQAAVINGLSAPTSAPVGSTRLPAWRMPLRQLCDSVITMLAELRTRVERHVQKEREAEEQRRSIEEQAARQRQEAEAVLHQAKLRSAAWSPSEGGQGAGGKASHPHSGTATPQSEQASGYGGGGGDLSPSPGSNSGAVGWSPEDDNVVIRRRASGLTIQSGGQSESLRPARGSVRAVLVAGSAGGVGAGIMSGLGTGYTAQCYSAPQSPAGRDRDVHTDIALEADLNQPSSARVTPITSLSAHRVQFRRARVDDVWGRSAVTLTAGGGSGGGGRAAAALVPLRDMWDNRPGVGLGAVAQRYRKALQRIRTQEVIMERMQDRIESLEHDAGQVRTLYRSLNQSLFDKVVRAVLAAAHAVFHAPA